MKNYIDSLLEIIDTKFVILIYLNLRHTLVYTTVSVNFTNNFKRSTEIMMKDISTYLKR